MKSAIAILTYRRIAALEEMLRGVNAHCAQHRLAIFEDCGQRDSTADKLQAGRTPVSRPHLLATEYVVPENGLAAPSIVTPTTQVFMGSRNVGVAANSNRALRWFMEETDADHLCLCNDDLHVYGDFAKVYADGHKNLDVGMWCFTDFDYDESYKWMVYPWRGYKVKLFTRFTGIMMSVTRDLVNKIGYFDPQFKSFGQEHCDYTIRARLAGGIRLGNQPMACLDLEHACLKHQDVMTSVVGTTRRKADYEADLIMRRCSASYGYRHYYRPFGMRQPDYAAGLHSIGMPVSRILPFGYSLLPHEV